MRAVPVGAAGFAAAAAPTTRPDRDALVGAPAGANAAVKRAPRPSEPPGSQLPQLLHPTRTATVHVGAPAGAKGAVECAPCLSEPPCSQLPQLLHPLRIATVHVGAPAGANAAVKRAPRPSEPPGSQLPQLLHPLRMAMVHVGAPAGANLYRCRRMRSPRPVVAAIAAANSRAASGRPNSGPCCRWQSSAHRKACWPRFLTPRA